MFATLRNIARGVRSNPLDAAMPPRTEPVIERAENAITTQVLSSDPQVLELFGTGIPSVAGVALNDATAMRLSAVYAATRLIAGAIAMLPCNVYERTSTGRRRIEHDLWWLLNEQPSPAWTSASMWEWLATCMLLRGDAPAHIDRDRNGQPREIIPLWPDTVIWDQVAGQNLLYAITLPGTQTTVGCTPEDMLHMAGFGFNGIRSMSVIRYAAYHAASIGLAAEQHAAKFMENGAKIQFALSTPGKMKDDAKESLRQSFAQRYSGNNNAFKTPLILTDGMEIKPLSLNAADAQLLETRKFQVEDIARAFGVPPMMIGQVEKTTSFGSGVEHMSLGFLTYTLGPHLRRWEQELNRKFWPLKSRYFVEFDRKALLALDTKALAEYYSRALGGSAGPGWLTQDEVRHEERREPMGGAAAQLYYPPAGASRAPAPAPEPAPAPKP